MGNMSNRKKITYTLILLTQILIVYFFCSNYEDKLLGKEEDSYQQSFQISELKNRIGTVQENMYCVDSTMVEDFNENGEVFTYGPYASLYPGDYQVTVHYETDSEGNQVRIYSNDNPDLMYSTEYTLPKEESEYTFQVSFDRKMEDFEVQTVYFGEGYLHIKSIDISSSGVISENNQFAAIIKCLAWIVFFVLLDLTALYLSKNKSHLFYLAVILFVTFLISAPLYTPKLLSGHDIMFHLGRIYGIKDELLNGHFYIKLQPNWVNDYGYLVGVFYGDLFLYIPAVLNILGLTMMSAYKVFLVLITLGTGIITYFCIHDIYKDKKVSLLGSILYTVSIYRLLDLYLRHSVGESLAMMFFPLIICGLHRIYRKEDNRLGWLFLSTGLFGLIHSHILSCEMAGIFMLFFFLINIKATVRKDVLKQLGTSFAVTILASLSFIVPFLECYSMGNLNVMNADRNGFSLEDRGIVLTQLLELFVPASGSNQDVQLGFVGEMPLTIGFALVCCIFISIITAFLIKDKKKIKTLVLFTVFGLLSIVMSTIYFPWDSIRRIPFLENAISSIQFPWRFLALAAVFTTFCICESIILLKETKYKTYLFQLGNILILVSVFSAMYFIAGTNNRDDYIEFHSSKELNLVTTGDEYLPINTDIKLLDGEYHVIGDMELSNDTKNGTTIFVDVNAQEDSVLEVPLIYYRYYQAVINGDKLEVYGGNNNVVAVKVPAGTNGTIRISYAMPLHWMLSFVVSLITVVVIMIYLIYDRIQIHQRKQKEENNS